MSTLTGLVVPGAVLAALLTGIVWGASIRAGAAGRTAARRQKGAEPRRRGPAASKLIALGVLAVDASSTYIVLYLCWLSIRTQFSGSLPYLTTLIGALQAATGYVLGHYFKKSTRENTRGGITYDAALGSAFDTDAANDL